MNLIIATGNAGKTKEYRDILSPLGFSVFSQKEMGLDPAVEENWSSFEESALLKARAVHALAPGWVLSDVSGL